MSQFLRKAGVIAGLFVVCALTSSQAMDTDAALSSGAMARDGYVATTQATFDLNPSATTAGGSGPSNLSSTLAVSGTTLTTDLFCNAADAVPSTSWACSGATLVPIENGASPVLDAAPVTESAARGLDFTTNGADFYAAPTPALGNFSTEDFVVEAVVSTTSATGAKSFLGVKADATAASPGWALRCSSSSCSSLQLLVSDGTNAATASTSAANAWQHLLCFFKHNAASGAQCFVDGVAGVAVSTASVGSITSPDTLAVGSWESTATSTAWRDAILAVGVWHCSGCLDTTAYQAVALDRFQHLVGLYPQVAAGSAAMTFTRSTAATIAVDRDCDGTVREFTVGAGWPRVVKRKDADGVCRTGFLSEPQSTNIALQSQTLDNAASWTAVNVTVAADATAAPDATRTADTLVAASGAGSVEHAVTQTVTDAPGTSTFSAFVKAASGAATWAFLDASPGASANGWVRLSDCASGTKGAGTSTLTTDSYGDGWCRVAVTYSITSGAHVHHLGLSNADATESYDDGTTLSSVYVWGAQVEAQNVATSYVATTTASVTRNKDELLYSPTSNAPTSVGTFEVTYVCPQDFTTTASFRPGSISDGSADSIFLTSNGPTNIIGSYNNASVPQASVSATVPSFVDNREHAVRALYAPNDYRLFFDGAQQGSTDTSVTTFADGTATRISVLNNGASPTGGQVGCYATRVRAWPKVVTP